MQVDSDAMKKTLSFWKSFSGRVRSVGRGLRVFWMADKFEWFPSEENLLISFWYDWAHYRYIRPNHTIDQFINRRIASLEEYVNNPKNKEFKRMLKRVFLKALDRERIREMAVDFLESYPPEHHYAALMEAIWSAWRTDEREIGAVLVGVRHKEADDEKKEGKVVNTDREEGQAIGQAGLVGGGGRPLNAKTYVIAVQLYFEVEGREEEFGALSSQVPEMIKFIKVHFGVENLPGRMEEFKGYSYKKGLQERSSAKKGQLRPPFKQIAQHPEIFGKAVAERAQEILTQHFH